MEAWNDLPDDVVVDVESVREFEKRLDKAWRSQQQRFNYREKIKKICKKQGAGVIG